MSEFRVKGKELLIREAKAHGGGGIVYVPKKWVGDRVAIIRGVENGNK